MSETDPLEETQLTQRSVCTPLHCPELDQCTCTASNVPCCMCVTAECQCGLRRFAAYDRACAGCRTSALQHAPRLAGHAQLPKNPLQGSCIPIYWLSYAMPGAQPLGMHVQGGLHVSLQRHLSAVSFCPVPPRSHTAQPSAQGCTTHSNRRSASPSSFVSPNIGSHRPVRYGKPAVASPS